MGGIDNGMERKGVRDEERKVKRMGGMDEEMERKGGSEMGRGWYRG